MDGVQFRQGYGLRAYAAADGLLREINNLKEFKRQDYGLQPAKICFKPQCKAAATTPPVVVREALRLLEEHERARAAQMAEFNEEFGRRLASLDRGKSVAPSEVRSRLRRKKRT